MSSCIRCGKPVYWGNVLCPEHMLDQPVQARSTEAAPPRPIPTASESPIPPKYRWATLDGDGLTPPGKDKSCVSLANVNVAAQWVGERAVLCGGAGAGKTSLACAMMAASLAKNPRRSHLFVGAYYLAKARWQHRFGQGEAPLVERALSCYMLVLDDVGVEQAHNSVVEEVIYERHAEEKRTIVTTGFSLEQLAKKYGDGICRRIYEGALVIRC